MGWSAAAWGAWVLAFSPWAVPELPPSADDGPMQVCVDGQSPRQELASAPAVPMPKLQPRPDDSGHSADIERGPSPRALMAGGIGLFVLGTAMKVPAPAWIEIDPDADPLSGEPTARVGYSRSYPGQNERTVVLGTVGSLIQAVGAGLLSRGVERRRR